MIDRKNIIFFLSVIAGAVLLVSLQSFIISVEASAGLISVSIDKLNFGIVFPGEQLEKEFTVYLATTTEVKYTITRTKPGDLDLCPSLFLENEEEEGDTATSSTLSPTSIPPDLSDTWKIVFKVPAILGFVAQDHIFGIVSSGGDYGCDIGIEILE
jgi:hypothetical protein